MNKYKILACVIAVAALAGCSTTGMTVTKVDENGRHKTLQYTKYYSAAEWITPDEVGMEIWVDHEKKVGPFYGIQRAMGMLGPGDLRATGLITVCFINLEETPRQIADFQVAPARGAGEPMMVNAIELPPRSVTQIIPGRVDIANYGTQVALSVQYSEGDDLRSSALVAQRRTQADMQEPRKDFPWFQPPHFPFDPPLSVPEN